MDSTPSTQPIPESHTTSGALSGKVIVVTGATGVLGEAFVYALANAGAQVALLGRNAATGEARAAALQAAGREALFVQADVLNRDDLEAAATRIVEHWGKIDGLVNGAGGNVKEAVLMPGDDLWAMNIDALRQVFDLNLYGTVWPSLIFGRYMAANGQGSIVNISSAASSKAITRVLGYSMAKTAVDSFTRWMCAELGLRYKGALRMNSLAPGFFIAEQNRALMLNPDGTPTARGESVIRNTPYGRFGEPHELGGALVWLLSDAAAFVSGQVIRVDGGFDVFSGV